MSAPLIFEFNLTTPYAQIENGSVIKTDTGEEFVVQQIQKITRISAKGTKPETIRITARGSRREKS